MGVAAGADNNFVVRDLKEITDIVKNLTGMLTALLGAIAGISLLVVGIMNIMLVSVTERTREIGIRLAIGALGGEVLWQFLIEALALSFLGGVIGILLRLGTSDAASQALGVHFGPDPWIIAVARLDPIEALRYE